MLRGLPGITAGFIAGNKIQFLSRSTIVIGMFMFVPEILV